MSKPDLDWFERRLNGTEGWAIRDLMRHTRVHILIDYIKELEKSHDPEGMHQVQDKQGTP